MKAYTAAWIVLILTLLCVCGHALYVNRTVGALIGELEALPEVPGAETLARIQGLREEIRGAAPFLRLSVPEGWLDRIGTAAYAMEFFARQGKISEYAAARDALGRLLVSIRQAEQIRVS